MDTQQIIVYYIDFTWRLSLSDTISIDRSSATYHLIEKIWTNEKRAHNETIAKMRHYGLSLLCIQL